ncbi:hypothetical protein GGF32_006784, partial [Allomyces javanicus]
DHIAVSLKDHPTDRPQDEAMPGAEDDQDHIAVSLKDHPTDRPQDEAMPGAEDDQDHIAVSLKDNPSDRPQDEAMPGAKDDQDHIAVSLKDNPSDRPQDEVAEMDVDQDASANTLEDQDVIMDEIVEATQNTGVTIIQRPVRVLNMEELAKEVVDAKKAQLASSTLGKYKRCARSFKGNVTCFKFKKEGGKEMVEHEATWGLDFKEHWKEILDKLPETAVKMISDLLHYARKLGVPFDVDVAAMHDHALETRTILSGVNSAERHGKGLDLSKEEIDAAIEAFDWTRVDKQEVAVAVQRFAGTRGDPAWLVSTGPNDEYPYVTQDPNGSVWIRGKHKVVKTATRDNQAYMINAEVPQHVAEGLMGYLARLRAGGKRFVFIKDQDPTKEKETIQDSFNKLVGYGCKKLFQAGGTNEIRRLNATWDAHAVRKGEMTTDEFQARCNSRGHSVKTAATTYCYALE